MLLSIACWTKFGTENSNGFQALDILGGTSWRIRAPILDVVEKMWADGGGLANLVDANDVRIIMICRFSNSFLSSDSTILEMLNLTGNLHV